MTSTIHHCGANGGNTHSGKHFFSGGLVTLGAISRYFRIDRQLSPATILARSGTKVSPTIVQLRRLRDSDVIASAQALMELAVSSTLLSQLIRALAMSTRITVERAGHVLMIDYQPTREIP
jgi:hypothetical protein